MTLQLNLNGEGSITVYIYLLGIIGGILLSIGGFFYSIGKEQKSSNFTTGHGITLMSTGGVFSGILIIFLLLRFFKIIEHDPNIYPH